MENPSITDPLARQHFDAAFEATTDRESRRLLDEADALRFGSPAEQLRGAYLYYGLACAFAEKECDLSPLTVGKAFHFAGHALREIGHLNQSGEAYWRGGLADAGLECDDLPRDPLDVRSFSRGKNVFADAGDISKSDILHRLEWEARLRHHFSLGLWVWKTTSLYGTSFRRWLASATAFVVAWTLAYELAHHEMWVAGDAHWQAPVTPAYFSIVTTATMGFGDVTLQTWEGQLLATLHTVSAFALVAVGATILARKVLGR